MPNRQLDTHPIRTRDNPPEPLAATMPHGPASLNGNHDPKLLSEENRQLQAANRTLNEIIAKQNEELDRLRGDAGGPDGFDLVTENTELRQLVDRLRGQLAQLDAANPGDLKDYEAILEEKTETIRQLFSRVKELEAKALETTPSTASRAGVTSEAELAALFEELERERAEFAREQAETERQRKELEEDEHSLRVQMRDMEVQMARERAELARQRNELQRLHMELKHEMDNASRDAGIREKLEPLYRLQQEVLGRKDSGVRPRPGANGLSGNSPPARPAPNNGAKRSGFFSRLFSRDQE